VPKRPASWDYQEVRLLASPTLVEEDRGAISKLW
jgi:hypothetical protein